MGLLGRGPEGCRGPLQHRARAGLGPGRQLCDRAQHLTSLRLGDSSFLREDSGPISQGCGEGHGRLGGQHHAAQSTSRDLTEHLLCDRLCPRSGVQWPVAPVQPTMGGLQPTGEKGSRGPATWLSAERGQEPAAPMLRRAPAPPRGAGYLTSAFQCPRLQARTGGRTWPRSHCEVRRKQLKQLHPTSGPRES